jgi:hypothetical protein
VREKSAKISDAKTHDERQSAGRMARYELKTRENDASVEEFLESVENKTRRADGFRVLEMFKKATGEVPKMWGNAIIGFGKVNLRYADGRELDWPAVGFSPRKQNMTLYVVSSTPTQRELLAKLGKHTTSVSCLYINKLADIDEKVLASIVKDSYKWNVKHNGAC